MTLDFKLVHIFLTNRVMLPIIIILYSCKFEKCWGVKVNFVSVLLCYFESFIGMIGNLTIYQDEHFSWLFKLNKK